MDLYTPSFRWTNGVREPWFGVEKHPRGAGLVFQSCVSQELPWISWNFLLIWIDPTNGIDLPWKKSTLKKLQFWDVFCGIPQSKSPIIIATWKLTLPRLTVGRQKKSNDSKRGEIVPPLRRMEKNTRFGGVLGGCFSKVWCGKIRLRFLKFHDFERICGIGGYEYDGKRFLDEL